MGAPAPIYRGQANAPFRSEARTKVLQRGQSVPYDTNGAPTLPPDEPGFLSIDINDLPTADPAEPLFEFVVPPGITVNFNGDDAITAGIAATSSTTLPLKINGGVNGSIVVTGSTGAASFSDSSYTAGDLFSLYPPASADATLDRVRIALGVD